MPKSKFEQIYKDLKEKSKVEIMPIRIFSI